MFLMISFLIIIPKVLGLGENGNLTELYDYVEANIAASDSYVIPTDQSALTAVTSTETQYYGTFDFIVVGAGPAGSVVANRLTEVDDWSVLLLEAGFEPTDFNKILAMNSYVAISNQSWGYNTTTQLYGALGMDDQQSSLAQGRMIGGGTAINAAVYARGHEDDYNRWRNVYGISGWDFDTVFPYFLKSENATFDWKDDGYHGTDGLWTVSTVPNNTDTHSVLVDAYAELGLTNLDYNGEYHNGVGTPQFALKGNERVTGASAYIDNFLNRTNLNLTSQSYVTEILIDDSNTAYGVRFIKNGIEYTANVSKEVIISGGSVNTAKLLLLSGIGPKDDLEALDIDVKQDLHVGQNLSDHVMFIGNYFRTNFNLYNYTVEEELELYVEHLRPLIAGFSAELLGFTNFGQNQSVRPELEIMNLSPCYEASQLPRVFRINEDWAEAYSDINPLTDFWITLVLLHPESRGTVTLQSKDPSINPEINPNYLLEDQDVEKLYQAIELMIELNNTDTFKTNGVQMTIFDFPSCTDEKLSKDWWICGIRHQTSTVYHPAGTAQIGADPSYAVVDSTLKVYGINNLRVADCSILPEQISGHNHAVALMIGERAADFIKSDYNQTIVL